MNDKEGKIFIDKPAGWSSFDVVAKVRYQIKYETGLKLKVGHAGTLDPFATGLLIVLCGSETKNQDHYMKLNKEYEATLFLGATSTTGDPEGIISKKDKVNKVTKAEIEEVIKIFLGEIDQIPPQYSAIKINGQRAYQLAREGKSVKMKPRKITIISINILNFDWPKLTLKIECSSGTYIRSLAFDIGEKLGCGAYLTALRRTKIGKYSVDGAHSLEG